MTAPFAELILNPIDPWDARGLGPATLAAVALTLVVLTLWTYAGVREAGWRRVLAVLALRLGALIVACLVILRPSFADRSETVVPSKLLIVVDDSLSMNIKDAFNGMSRWDAARHLLRAPPIAALLKRLQNEQKVEIIFYRASDEVRKFDPSGKAEGKRTDIGHWLRSLLKLHGNEQNLRGLVLVTDGIDNGTRFPALEEAARWRGVPCPIYTFALGSETATLKQNDIAVTAIHPNPSPVPVKNKLLVKAVIDAPGFEGQSVDVQLLIDGKPLTVNGKEVGPKRVALPKRKGNEIIAGEFTPETAGEIKVTVKVLPVEGELSVENNEMSTYVTVTSEGVSVLWVEGKKRAYESVFAIRHALGLDRRFNVFYTERLKGGGGTGQKDWFNFTNQHYDVIVIGDISADRFAGGNNEVFAEIKKMVEDKGTGLLMLGGAETMGKGGWSNIPTIKQLLPVDLTRDDAGEQIDERTKVKMKPRTIREGVKGREEIKDYVLRVGDGADPGIWENVLPPLEGMTRVGRPRDEADVFATGEIAGG
ncbi:MAG TPA: hypothetical protein VEL76_23670, partial [Gemmataceae bacterium]|nr:hypothetical protein [Gemmataceae bacterium]